MLPSSESASDASSSILDWLGASIQIAKHTVAVGESLPVPYVKGLASVVLMFLETIQVSLGDFLLHCEVTINMEAQTMKKNQSDLKELVVRVVDILRIVRDAVTAHREASDERFRKICIEFQG